MHRTEQVYDDEMAPLVTRLIEIAKREGMPMILSVGMIMGDETAGTCTTMLCGYSADPRLKGVSNRCGLASGIMRAHNGMDTAAGLMISRHHPNDA